MPVPCGSVRGSSLLMEEEKLCGAAAVCGAPATSALLYAAGS